jgi:hypothetical protein
VQFTSATSQTANFGACQAISLLVAMGTMEDNATTMTVSDSVNGAYAQDRLINPGGNTGIGRGSSGIFSFQNRSTSSKIVTITLGATTDGFLKIFEITGAAQSSAVDVSDDDFCNTGGGAVLSLSLITSTNNCAIFSCSTRYGGNGSAVDSGYSASQTETIGPWSYHMGEYDIDVGVAGAKSLTYNGYSSSNNHSAVAVAYKMDQGGVIGPMFRGS